MTVRLALLVAARARGTAVDDPVIGLARDWFGESRSRYRAAAGRHRAENHKSESRGRKWPVLGLHRLSVGVLILHQSGSVAHQSMRE